MTRKIRVAATQMNLTPAPTDARLARAGRLVASAAVQGAQLILLPEVFNTGYAYLDDNYRCAERIDGPTVTWLRQAAVQYTVHLGGTLLLLDHDEIYNAFLLFAPDGRMWRYDKNYPWGWERAYFRGSDRITVADTTLGRFGMLICWDIAHRDLWRRYAGQVDMMLTSASPPNMGDPVYHFGNGAQLTASQMGPLAQAMRGDGNKAFHDIAAAQTAWLGVPTVSAGVVGTFDSPMPCSRASLMMLLPTAPWLARYLPYIDDVRITSDTLSTAYARNADGTFAARLSPDDGESFIVKEITLPDERHAPITPQPPSTVSWASYFVSDLALPTITQPYYRRKTREILGPQMAPVDASARRRRTQLGLGMVLSFLAGVLFSWRRYRRRQRY